MNVWFMFLGLIIIFVIAGFMFLLNLGDCKHDWEHDHTIRTYSPNGYEISLCGYDRYKCKKCFDYKNVSHL